MKLGRGLVVITCCAALVLALAAASAARSPAPGEAGYKFKRANCVETSQGYRSVGIAKTYVNWLDPSDGDQNSVYYQKVTIQIDRLALGNMWRKVDARTYSWTRFTRSQKLPTWSTSGIRTGLMNDAATFSAKVTVKLKRERRGPDKTVWDYSARSASFECVNPNEGVWGEA